MSTLHLRWLKIGAAALTCVALSVLAGCASRASKDPIGVFLNQDTAPAERMEAIQHITPEHPLYNDPTYVRALEIVAWSGGHPVELRREAIDRLIEKDPEAFRSDLETRIVTLDDWPVMRHIFERGIHEQWEGFTTVAVLSYARPSQVYPDDRRPEREVIRQLNPGREVEMVVYDMFVGREGNARLEYQIAAWQLLCRLVEAEKLRAMLQAAPADSILVADLQGAAEVLDVLPVTREQLMWLMWVRVHEDGAYWRRVSQKAQYLQAPERSGLALRHLAMLDALPGVERAAGSSQLQERIRGRIEQQDHQARTDGVAVTSESWEDAAPHLVWGDLAMIYIIQNAMQDPALTDRFFGLAMADQMDHYTEHGGVLASRNGGIAPIDVPPDLRVHDRTFYAPVVLIERMYTSLGHYHFHAQTFRNGAYAGPGAGDLEFANRHGAACIVLTFIDRSTLNVDYYQPGGVVIDLGMIRR